MAFDLRRALAEQGKAIPAHPALQGYDPVSVYQPGYRANNARKPGALTQREASHHLQAYGGREAIDYVMDCVRLYADATATAPWRLEKEDGTKLVKKRYKDTPPDYKLGPRELYDLLDKPNPYMIYDELVELLIIDLLLVGNAYWFKWQMTSDGKPLALYRLCPSHVKIIPGAFGPEHYEYQPPGARDKLVIDPRQLLHFRLPNPHSAYYGLGIIQGGGRAFDLELALTDTMTSYYENRADPSLIVSTERRVPRDVFHKLRAQLRSRVSGSSRAGELLVLEAGLKADTLSVSARDALFHELSKMSRDRVYAKFRASPKLFGIIDELAGSDKVTDLRREFDNGTLRPFMDKLQKRITDGLVAAWGCKLVLDYRYQMPVEDLIRLGTAYAATPGLTIREIRRFFAPLGIPESTGDKTIDELVMNLPGNQLGADGQPVDAQGNPLPPGSGGFPQRNLPGQAGRPPLGTNTQSIPRNGGALPAGARARRKQGGKSLPDLLARLETMEAKAALETKALPSEQRPPDAAERFRTSEIDSAKAFIAVALDDAGHELERKLLDHVEGKAFKRSDVVQRLKNSPAWKRFTEMITQALEDGAKRSISAAAIHNADLGFAAPEELDYDAIAREVVHRKGGVRGIVQTLKDRVARAAKDARVNGAQPEVQAAVQGALRDWRSGQASTIADTEATVAYNHGTIAVAEALDLNEVVVSDGHDFDAPCADVDGQVWTLDQAREHPVEHPNCRRAFLLVPSTA